MRTFLAICLVSAAVHVALLLAVAVPYQRQTAHGETMSVELVPPSEAPSFNEEPASDDQQTQQSSPQQDKPQAAEAMPDFSKLRLSDTPKMPQDDQKQSAAPPPPEQQQQARQQHQQQQAQKQSGQGASPQAAPQQQPSPPPQQQAMLPQPAPPPETQQGLPEQPKMAPEMAVETPADQYERLAALMNIPGTGIGPNAYGTEAETKAKLTPEEIGQFRAHLKTCWKLPAGVAETEKVKVIIRIALRPNGVLAEQPSLIEAAASEMGLPIYKNAVAALKQCAPYNMLPVEKYKEWRVLDINFSPDEMTRG
jgi:hypothetical protein